MENIVLPILLAILSSTVVNTLVQYFLDKAKYKKSLIENSNAEIKEIQERCEKASRFTMLYILKNSGKEYIEQGWIDANDLRAFNEVYQTYKELDGDGYAEQIHDKVNKLDVSF